MGLMNEAGCGTVRGTWRGLPVSRPAPSNYIWLAYSIFFFLPPLFRHELRYWLECLGIYAVFLVLYVGLDVIEDLRVKRSILFGFVVLGGVTLPFNPASSTFLLYFASFLPFQVASLPAVAVLTLLDFLLLIGEELLLKENIFNYAIPGFFLLVGAVSSSWIARQKRMNAKLAMAQEEIHQLAAVAERERIARDLHDVLGHTLSVIVLKAELAGRLIERDPARAALEIAEVESTARTALAEVREAIGGYRAKGLSAELAMARRTLDAAGVTLTYEADAVRSPGQLGPAQLDAAQLDAAQETVLSLVVREAVTNIVRHAEATQCRMRLATTPDGFHALLVEDNGPHAVKHEGNGLRGMRERVEALGGRFRVTNGQGTRLVVELPMAGIGVDSGGSTAAGAPRAAAVRG